MDDVSVDTEFWNIVREQGDVRIKLPRNDRTWKIVWISGLLFCILFWIGVAAGAGLLVTGSW